MNNHYHILICDINIKPQGHYIGYNQYMLEEFQVIQKNNPGVYISFLFNREAENLLSFNGDIMSRVSFIDLKDRGSLYNRFSIIRLIKKYTKQNRVDHLLFMDFDQFQIPFYFIKFNLGISGILFRPHHRIDSPNNSFQVRASIGFRRFRKKMAEKFIVAKKEIENVFILNDRMGVSQLNKIHHSSVFKYLPDPVFSYIHKEDTDHLMERDTETCRFLVFGSITIRKNIFNIIQAYEKAFFSQKTELLIVGPCSEEYWVQVNNTLKSLKSIDGIHKSIHIKRAFVTNREMDYYFSISNVCLLIYKDFFGSSGLLGRSALHKLKVIGPNAGLLKELIISYRMGLTVDPSDVDEIALSFQNVIGFKVHTVDLESFYRQHSPEKFIGTLAESVTP
jgi:glycosyltransferase involved in cell wall biosynthesis